MPRGIYKRTECHRRITSVGVKRAILEGRKKRINSGTFKKGDCGHKGYKHSSNTKKKISLNKKGKSSWNKGISYHSGEKHWNWKGGITSITKRLRCNMYWKIWRKAVFLRDNFICQNPKCKYCNNKIGVKLHPHHIKPRSLYPKMIYNINNGITYCEDYHLKSGLHKNIMGGE